MATDSSDVVGAGRRTNHRTQPIRILPDLTPNGAAGHHDPVEPGHSALDGRTISGTGDGSVGRSFRVMEPHPSVPTHPSVTEPAASVAEDLPELYRAILERVAGLERIGARAEAGRIRMEATRAYSSAWDESARRLLMSLLVRADRSAEPPARARSWTRRRRRAEAR